MTALQESEHLIKRILFAADLTHGISHMLYRLHIADFTLVIWLLGFTFFRIFVDCFSNKFVLMKTIFFIRCIGIEKFRCTVHIMLLLEYIDFLLSETQIINYELDPLRLQPIKATVQATSD